MEDDESLAALRALGVPEGSAKDAVDHDRVALALVQQLAARRGTLTVQEVADRAGIDPDLLRERYRMLGIADTTLLTEADVEDAVLLARISQDISREALLRVMQVDAQALHQVALAHLEIAYGELLQPIRDAGGDEVAAALALAEAYASLTEPATRLVASSYQHILERMMFSELVAEAARGGGETVHLAVGFADLVGYTSLSMRVDPVGLEEVIEAFEARCYAVAGAHADVELVKFLGDAVMLVSADPLCLADALLALAEPAPPESPLAGSPVRAGLAHGEVLLRGGDYYGTTVNTAARLTERARAGRVLADEHLRDVLQERFEVRRVTSMTLRGLGRRRPVSIRPPAG